MAEEGFFFGLGPWPNVGIDMGLRVFYPPPPTIIFNCYFSKPTPPSSVLINLYNLHFLLYHFYS